MHGPPKTTVYIIQSQRDPSKFYTGITNDLLNRVDWHNRGGCRHTINEQPWSVVVSLQFRTERDAVRFERYLKSGSERAFVKRHFAPLPVVSEIAIEE